MWHRRRHFAIPLGKSYTPVSFGEINKEETEERYVLSSTVTRINRLGEVGRRQQARDTSAECVAATGMQAERSAAGLEISTSESPCLRGTRASYVPTVIRNAVVGLFWGRVHDLVRLASDEIGERCRVPPRTPPERRTLRGLRHESCRTNLETLRAARDAVFEAWWTCRPLF